MTIQLENVSFSYGDTEVLREINLNVESGKVVGFAGLNGAGKSTLLKLLAKRHLPTSGMITFNEIGTVAYVPQEVDEGLVQGLTVIENLMLAIHREKKHVFFSKKKSIEFATQKLSSWNLSLPFLKTVSDCSIYEKQLILIAKALLNDASLFLFDEPTSSLGKSEKEQFFSFLKVLKKQGKSIVVILHSIEEILSHCDEVVILKNGEINQQSQSTFLTKEVIVEKMSSSTFSFNKKRTLQDELAYKFHNINLVDSKPSINIEIKKGEVIVIYGANGNKKSTLAKTLWGDKTSYDLIKENKTVSINSPISAKKQGIAFVPEDRRKEGIFLHHTIRENVSIHEQGWIKKNLEVAKTNSFIQSLSIFPKDTEKEVIHLSGGNQQKVSIAKWITPNTRCLILDEPLKGVDIYAKQHIFQFIDDFCSNGGCVFYFTNDIEEANVIGDKHFTIVQGELLEGIK